MNFKLIKSKAFTFDSAGVETKGTVYTVAYKGRVFNVSSLSFDADALSVKDGVLAIKGECDVVAESYTNAIGELVKGLKLMPKMDLVISAF
jgi:hypothetical protein